MSGREGQGQSLLLLSIDHRALARAALAAVGRGLREARLAWRQLSRLRFFYRPGHVDEGELRAAVAGAMARATMQGEEGEGEEGVEVATTFVPVARLQGGAEKKGEEEEGVVLLRVQAVALDLERLRTEAWVHEVPEAGI